MKMIFNKEGVNLNWYQFNWKSLYKEEDTVSNVEDLVSELMTIFPNPADEYLNIKIDSKQGGGDIMILSIDGKTLSRQTRKCKEIERINVSGFEKGIYILKVNFESFVMTKKFIIE